MLVVYYNPAAWCKLATASSTIYQGAAALAESFTKKIDAVAEQAA